MAEYVIFRRRRACVCVAEWIPWFEKVLIMEGVIKRNVDIAQLTGNAGPSGGTHRQGGAMDFWTLVKSWWKFLVIARQMGADASWRRTPGQGPWDFHFHCVLRGCRHNSPCRYQINEVDNNQDGLRGSRRDDGPRPLSKRTWREGIAWAKQKLGEDKPIADWKPEVQTYKVVTTTTGYEIMWSKTKSATVRQPGYIIKTIGRSTKDPIGVMTEHKTWYRQSDLMKVPGGEHNPMDPEGYKLGIQGDQVLWLGQRLVLWGIKNYTPTRTYTTADVSAIKRFQTQNKLYVDGIPGPKTLAALAKDPS
jgi:hypothetical protein